MKPKGSKIFKKYKQHRKRKPLRSTACKERVESSSQAILTVSQRPLGVCFGPQRAGRQAWTGTFASEAIGSLSQNQDSVWFTMESNFSLKGKENEERKMSMKFGRLIGDNLLLQIFV